MAVTFRTADILPPDLLPAPTWPTDGVPLKMGGKVVGRAYADGTARITDDDAALYFMNHVPAKRGDVSVH